MRLHLVRHSCVDGKDNLSINPEVEEIGGAPAFLLISHFFKRLSDRLVRPESGTIRSSTDIYTIQ